MLTTMMKPYLKAVIKEKIDWDFVFLCWEKEYREAQYVGIKYLMQHKKDLISDDIDKIKRLIVTKSWWEVTDSLDEIVGILVLLNPKLKEMMLKWSMDDNIWIRRVSIDFQQKYKQNTDTEILRQTYFLSQNRWILPPVGFQIAVTIIGF